MNPHIPDRDEYAQQVFNSLTDDKKRAVLEFVKLLIPESAEAPSDQQGEADAITP